jgi:predicted ferric reductase
MDRIRYAFWGILLTGTLLWSLTDTLFVTPVNWFALRKPIVQYSGLLSIIAMSTAMVLALRLRFLDKLLDGLDKSYRLHKWLGISALSTAIIHWWFAQGTKWMVGWGVLARPERKNPALPDTTTLEGWLADQRHLAENIGEWAFYVAAALLMLALIKRFPYRWFAKTHTLLAVTYLLLAWHSFALVQFEYWREPVGIVTAFLLMAGSCAALLVLLGQVGRNRQCSGTITALQNDPETSTLTLTVDMANGWRGHSAGQFAFLTTHRREGAHPFTIASAWHAENHVGHRLVFQIKALGDYTRNLPQTLEAGQTVHVEGPYGCFTFESPQPRQIWVGAGIGITPFMARLEELATRRSKAGHDDQPVMIDLFHPVNRISATALETLRQAADAAGARLHVWNSQQNGFLTGKAIRDRVPDWQNASVWFCGPTAFGLSLSSDFVREGLPARHFHRELFDMR